MNGDFSVGDAGISDRWKLEGVKPPNGVFLKAPAGPRWPQHIVDALDKLEQIRDWAGLASGDLRSMQLQADLHAAQPSPPGPPAYRTQGVADVAAERARQIDEEGYTARRDDGTAEGNLTRAGIAYGFFALCEDVEALAAWPRDWEKPKPRDRRRNLVRAAALIIAAIDRHDRACARIEEAKAQEKIEEPPPAPKRPTYEFHLMNPDGVTGRTLTDLPAPVAGHITVHADLVNLTITRLMLKDGSVWTYHHQTGVLTEVVPA